VAYAHFSLANNSATNNWETSRVRHSYMPCSRRRRQARKTLARTLAAQSLELSRAGGDAGILILYMAGHLKFKNVREESRAGILLSNTSLTS